TLPSRCSPWRAEVTLLHNLQLRTPVPAALFRGARCLRRLGTEVLLGKHHALARLARIDSHDRTHGKADMVYDTREARVELDILVPQMQPLGRTGTEVEHDLALLDVRFRNIRSGTLRVDDHVGSVSAVGHPLVHRTKEVRTLGRRRWNGHG